MMNLMSPRSYNVPYKLIFLLIMMFGLGACVRETKSNSRATETSDNMQDTVIVKQKNALNSSHEVDFLAKSYSYYWLVGKDTLDLIIYTREYVKDSTVHLSIHNVGPVLFSTVLAKINKCYPIIQEDFDLSKLHSLNFEAPIYYLDLVSELSSEYERQFGRKRISHKKLNRFLLNSKLNEQLSNLVNPLEKSVKNYSIEKFHLTEKEHFESYLPNVDLTEYPEFAIDGMSLYVQLEDKKE